MEISKLLSTNGNPFDPTPKLKSSILPILFVPFNKYDVKCFNCGDRYTWTLFYNQKYCKKCLSRYIVDKTDSSTCLDMCIYTTNLKCNEHGMSRNRGSLIQNIQDWCEICSGVSYFKQIHGYGYNYYKYDFEYIKSMI